MIDTQNPWDGALSLWREAARLIGEAKGEALAYLAITIALWSLIDLEILGEGFFFPAMIVDFLCAYFLTVWLIKRGDLAPSGLMGGFGTYFLLSLLSGFAILIGSLLFVVPGIILMVRWLPLYGYALAEGAESTDAMGLSWEATREHFWTLFVAIVLPVLATLAPIVPILMYDVSAIFGGDISEGYLGASQAMLFLGTVISSVAVLLTTAIGIASYSLLRDPTASLNSVFE
ncbi:MAG: hypothetical protein QNJ15_05435 [Erythrobacter sp.]|nr:hypothetical protein [Erythrobacter sp.]